MRTTAGATPIPTGMTNKGGYRSYRFAYSFGFRRCGLRLDDGKDPSVEFFFKDVDQGYGHGEVESARAGAAGIEVENAVAGLL